MLVNIFLKICICLLYGFIVSQIIKWYYNSNNHLFRENILYIDVGSQTFC